MVKVVARFKDGTVLKGTTQDFAHGKEQFHMMPWDNPGHVVTVRTADLKAVFFVKDYEGDYTHIERNTFEGPIDSGAHPIRVVFEDDEELIGTTYSYRPERHGFFLVPADEDSNIERCYVIKASTKIVELL